MKRSELQGEKWRKFLCRVKLFRFVPFIDFVLAAGSLATGNLHENSDFDVIVGASQGRIFTARFFSVLIFSIPGWRRSKLTRGKAAADKICLSHFVTPRGYKLHPPYNEYWQSLYQSLVPISGKREKISEFFASNDWLDPKRAYDVKNFKSNPFHITIKGSRFKSLMEGVFHGRAGNYLEKWFKSLQIKRIERSLVKNLGYKPRIVCNDDELEFHPDTKRIDEIVKSIREKQKGS